MNFGKLLKFFLKKKKAEGIGLICINGFVLKLLYTA